MRYKKVTGSGEKDVLKGKPNTSKDLDGSDGKDKLMGGRKDDDLSGGGGNDRLFGRAGDDLILGDAGNDRLKGGSGSDELYGGEGDDGLKGGSGSDLLDGGAGNDKLHGAAGADIFVLSSGMDLVRDLKKQDEVRHVLGAEQDASPEDADVFTFKPNWKAPTAWQAFQPSELYPDELENLALSRVEVEGISDPDDDSDGKPDLHVTLYFDESANGALADATYVFQSTTRQDFENKLVDNDRLDDNMFFGVLVEDALI